MWYVVHVCVRIQTVLCAIKQTQGTVRRVRHDISHCLHNRLNMDRKVSPVAFQLCCSSMVVWCVCVCVCLSQCSYPMSGPISAGLDDYLHIQVTFALFYCEFNCRYQWSWLPRITDLWNNPWLFTYHSRFLKISTVCWFWF